MKQEIAVLFCGRFLKWISSKTRTDSWVKGSSLISNWLNFLTYPHRTLHDMLENSNQTKSILKYLELSSALAHNLRVS